MHQRVAPKPLVCQECQCTSDDETEPWRVLRWRLYVFDDEETVTYCPECAERELGHS